MDGDEGVGDVVPRVVVADPGARQPAQLHAAEDREEHHRQERRQVHVGRDDLHHARHALEGAPHLEDAEHEAHQHQHRQQPDVLGKQGQSDDGRRRDEQYLPRGEAELEAEQQREGHRDAQYAGEAAHQHVHLAQPRVARHGGADIHIQRIGTLVHKRQHQ